MYCIVDIETTGNGIKGNKITEISIFKYDGYAITDEFTTLVNPECDIPYFITGLTGIDSSMVRNAPTIAEIAKEISTFTEGSVFVAHSVNFDYNIVKNELKSIGYDFTRKKLCTVRLSRKLLPGYHSYSLGKLCAALDIPLENRHRARGDAKATTLLFEKLLRTKGAEKVFNAFLNARSQEATLPEALPKESFQKLSTKHGVYYFKDVKGKILYVGKANNIKKRVLGHFYDKATREVHLCRETAEIDFVLSGSEVLALLMESEAIKRHYPPYNRAQKKNIVPYAIFSYEDRKGILHLAFNKAKIVPRALLILYSPTDCRLFLEQICEKFQLCPKYCHLQEAVEHCSHFRLHSCNGICREKELVTDYNEKVKDAIADIQKKPKDLIIKEKGRKIGEDAYILIQDGYYSGYGFVDQNTTITNLADIEAYLIPQKNTMECQRFIQSYLQRKGDEAITIELNASTLLS